MPDVCQSISEVRIQVFTINAKNLDCWNHPNMPSLNNRMGKRKPEKKWIFVPKVYKIKKMRQIFLKMSAIKIKIFFT